MSNGLLSVIIPVYNVKPYLKRCIDSVLNQTYQNIEIILINDGSTDGSKEICEEYAKNKKVIFIDQINRGQAAARNRGLDVASGDYIGFLDSDDYIDENMYEILIELLLKYQRDISACASVNVDINGHKYNCSADNEKIILIEKEQLLGDLYCNQNARSEVWNKVFRKEIIGKLRFKEGQKFEEIYFDRKVFMNSNGCVFINKQMHHYLFVRAGNTNSEFSESKMIVFDELDDVIEDLKDINCLEEAEKIKAMKLLFAILLGDQALRLGTTSQIKDRLREEFKKQKKANKGNKYTKRIKFREVLFSISPRLYHLFDVIKNNM